MEKKEIFTMEAKRSLSGREKFAYGIGAVGKDMVYMLSASYISIYFLDVMGISAAAIAVLLMAARVFDAFNDPIMGVLVAKTKTRWGKFRPWLLVGTVTNAVVLYLMFTIPPELNGAGLVAYASVTYILWGMTYTMMDIPFWSMIPAFTEAGKEREGLSAFARSCAGVGSALVSIVTVMSVAALGKAFGGTTDNEINRIGYSKFALIIAVLFVIFILITCLCIKEKSTVDMKNASIGEMFRALIQNDQAMTVVVAIVMINTALYITQQLVVHGGAGVAGMGQLSRFAGGSTVQPCHSNGRTGLALQGFVHGICTGQALDIGIAYGGDVVTHGDACFLRGRAVVDAGHLGVAGLVDAKLHANAQDFAALDVHQLGVGVGGVVAGVLVARAQQITGGQTVVQHRLVDGVVIVAADIAVHLSDLVVHTFLFFYAVDRAVEQTHGDEHRDGKGHGHGKDHDGDCHTQRNFTVHGSFLPVRAAAS